MTRHHPAPILLILFLFASAHFAIATPGDAGTTVPLAIVEAVRRDVALKTKLPADKLKLVRAQPHTWSDGCLGLARADEFCSMALVEGWQVMLSYRGKTWIYRTDEDGSTLRQESK